MRLSQQRTNDVALNSSSKRSLAHCSDAQAYLVDGLIQHNRQRIEENSETQVQRKDATLTKDLAHPIGQSS